MSEDKKKEGVDHSKRAFLTKVLIGGVAAVSTAAIAKKVVSSSSHKDVKSAYLKDEQMQDKVMKDKEYVLMTSEEKEHMVQMFVSDYYKQA